MTMIRVACVGIAVMDRIYYVEGLPFEGGRYVANAIQEVGGGPAATAAVAAKLEAQVDFIGPGCRRLPETLAGGAGVPGE